MPTLFLTRKYPPYRGGMETFSYELLQRFPKEHVDIVESGKNILVSSLLIFFRSLIHIHSASVIHIGDAVLAPVGALLHIISKKPVVVTVHGLELTSNYGGEIYHSLIRWSIQHIAHWVAVSAYTAELAKKYGIHKVSVIHHGVTMPDAQPNAREELEKKYTQLKNKKIILSVGRLIQRKGLAWFIGTVLPSLSDDSLLCIVSDGPQKKHIEHLVQQSSLAARVLLCGKVSAEELSQWYTSADLFIFPNVPIPYDVEGFGLTPLEASAYGMRVYASRLHGIPDAIHDTHNGTLLHPLAPVEWINILNAGLSTPHSSEERERIIAYVRSHWSWEKAVRSYADLFDSLHP
ncbi:MAG: glycosyltransferase family 4 protein [Candidatus Kerfeldbacteria bacterium]|nr:glycosyltransferase family 4 protein [Candidatus Kerfeldbacteria bacterium]